MSGGSGTDDPDGDAGTEGVPSPDGAPDDASDEEPGSTDRHPADETMRTGALPDEIRCPHCGEEESEQFAAFGSAVSVSQYWCRSCRTVFEAFKWR